MKAISDNNNRFFIYSDNTQVYENTIPAGYYKVRFDKRAGFFLTKINDFELKTNEKIYGNNKNKIAKIIQRYNSMDRNLGVIFSGDKGLGKSLTAKKLCIEMCNQGCPIIIVDENIHGITKFLIQLSGNFVILLEEFEKLFPSKENLDDEYTNNSIEFQEDFLTVFDNLENDHKLFIVTCNSLLRLSEFYLNRPGRFYYNMRFGYPGAEDIEEYMKNNLKEEYLDQLSEILDFSKKALLNYDSLRALAQEINYGNTFAEAIKDLNILKIFQNIFFSVIIELESKSDPNLIFTAHGDHQIKLDLFKKEIIQMTIRSNSDYNIIGSIRFKTTDVRINDFAKYYLDPNKVIFIQDTGTELLKDAGELIIKNIIFYQKERDSNYNLDISQY